MNKREKGKEKKREKKKKIEKIFFSFIFSNLTGYFMIETNDWSKEIEKKRIIR